MSVSTIHGNKGMVYLAGSGAAAVLLSARSWKFTMDTDLIETSTFGEAWKTWTPMPMKWEGTVEGNFDKNDSTPWDAVQTTLFGASQNPSAIILYPDRTDTSHCYIGSIWPRLSVTVDMKNVSRYTLDFTGEGYLVVF